MSDASTLPEVVIYSDGACSPNPGTGGWAAILLFRSTERVLTGRKLVTTSSRMELTAAIEALKALRRRCKVAFYSDSQYLKRGVEEWLPGWQRRGWSRSDGSLVKNQDLWQDLVELKGKHSVEWHWVKSHANHTLNERVHTLAYAAMKDTLLRASSS